MATSDTNIGRVLTIYKGDYNPNTAYEPMDFVNWERGMYYCITPTQGNAPDNPVYWAPMALPALDWRVPAISIPFASAVEVAANVMTTIATLAGAITITLGEPLAGYDNEWGIVITQGTTAYNIILPVIRWQYSAAPTFAAGSVTQIRLYYVDGTLNGVWST